MKTFGTGRTYVAAAMMAAMVMGCLGCGGGGAGNAPVAANGGPPAPPAPPGAPPGPPGANASGPPGAPPPPPVEAFEKVEWKVPPGGSTAEPLAVDLIEVEVGRDDKVIHLLDGCRDGYLTSAIHFEKREVGGDKVSVQLVFGRFDPATGKGAGPPIELGPPFIYYDQCQADMSPGGTLALLYMTNPMMPEEVGRIWVLDAGATAPRKPKAELQHARWFRWSADNRLLLLKDGKLEAWDVDGDAPAWTVGEKLELPILLSPARNWVIATVDTRYLEVFDAATGTTLARFGAEGQWQYLSASADGTRLSGVRYADYPRAPSTGPNEGKYDVHAWDLADGKQLATFSHRSYGPPAWWVGPHHVFHDSKVWDLDTRQAIAAVQARPPIASPDGRMWFANKSGQAYTAKIPLAPAGGMQAFAEKAAVKLQVVGPNPTRDKQVTEAMTAALSAGGYPVGESQWTVKLTTKETESGDVVFDRKQTYPVPRVEGEMQLIAPDGSVTSTSNYGASFQKDKSGYLVRTTKPNSIEIEYHYDFRGKTPREAILDECWARALEQLRSIKRLPVVWQVDGKYQPLPVPLRLELPAGAKG